MTGDLSGRRVAAVYYVRRQLSDPKRWCPSCGFRVMWNDPTTGNAACPDCGVWGEETRTVMPRDG